MQQWLLNVVLVLSALTTSVMPTEPAYCSHGTSVWNPLELCPRHVDVVVRLDDFLENKMAGQTLAVRAIRKAVARNVDRYANATSSSLPLWAVSSSLRAVFGEDDQGLKPLFMHFSGPTGVGKTMAARFIADAMFTAHNAANQLCGMMEIQMRAFSSKRDSDIESNLASIRGRVAEQLHKCERSVIIFDEIQEVPAALLDGMIDIFDDITSPLSHHGRTGLHKVNTAHCIVIVVSDLGSTKLDPAMTRDQAKKIIQEETDGRFARSRKATLLQNIVPFLPLSKEELKEVAEMELKTLSDRKKKEYRKTWGGRVTWTDEVPQWLANQCFQKDVCYEDGGRGIETEVEHHVESLVDDTMLQQCSSEGVNYDEIRLYISEPSEDEEMELKAKVDTVFAEHEFRRPD